jgi:hypothetical protein
MNSWRLVVFAMLTKFNLKILPNKLFERGRSIPRPDPLRGINLSFEAQRYF